jgi:NAD-dependent dihydropyrimidine dehydrogenase PreA subunit
LEQSDCLNKRGVKFAVENKKNSCIGCKACFFICPEACIEVYEAKKKK